jgi:hypothetical protein
MPKDKTFEVVVKLQVKAKYDCDAEDLVKYALDHARLINPDNGISVTGIGDARKVA